MAIKRGTKGIQRHRPMNGLRPPGVNKAAGQSRRFIAWKLQQDGSMSGDNDVNLSPGGGDDLL